MKHLAIIADGNRRWAKSMGLPIEFGYSNSLFTIENCCEWAIQNNVEFLTIYAFSTENWQRPSDQIDLIFKLGESYLRKEKSWYKNKKIKLTFLGRRDRIPYSLLEICEEMEGVAYDKPVLTLAICIDYGGRDEIIRAFKQGATTEEEISKVLTTNIPEPDLILRTGGEKRLSNFLLWQSAYAELMFIDNFFPELDFELLNMVKQNFETRNRNYGG